MIRRKKDQVEWLEFEQLQKFPELVHGVFLKHGGLSQSPYHSLNCGGGSGDDVQIITANRAIIKEILDLQEIVSSLQVHEDRVIEVPTKLSLDEGYDGLITQERNLGLLIKHADCQATIFFDPVTKVIANVHCGWRGSVKNIYAKTVQYFVERFQSRPENLLVCISPSLGPDWAEFINHREELPEIFFSFQTRDNFFDFWEISRMQLCQEGVLDEHIEIAQLCTFAEKNDFFSHRRDKKTGRHGTVVALKLQKQLSKD